jgi:hypothetical protein
LEVNADISAADFGQPVYDYLAQAWSTYTITNANGGTPGAGRANGRYKLLGTKTVTLSVMFEYGTGAYGGSGAVSFNLPPNMTSPMPDYSAVGTAHYIGGGGSVRYTCTVFKVLNGMQIWGSWGAVTNAVPATVQIGDAFYFAATLEIT